MDSKILFEKIDEFAKREIEKTGLPQIYNYDVANKNAKKLANLLGVDENLAMCCTALMDIKLGEAVAMHKQPEHIKMSAEFSSQILEEIGADDETKNLLIDAVLSHHGSNGNYNSTYAEIASNADCYRFISWTGAFSTYGFAVKTLGKSHNEALDFVKFKLTEKYNVLSLEHAKEELVKEYDFIISLVEKAYV